MRSLQEAIQESMVIESADKFMKELLGKPLTFSAKMSGKFKELGMDYNHIDDTFTVFADGRVVYSNRYLFTIPFTAKVPATWLNRIIPADNKVLKLSPHVGHVATDIQNPYHYIRAVLNAFAQGFIEASHDGGVINDLDYTKGDFTKDKE